MKHLNLNKMIDGHIMPDPTSRASNLMEKEVKIRSTFVLLKI